MAQEIYQELTEMGFQVFFARITLEDKLGEEYEPTIFAALNSARVMVAVGASRENLESVWVKNEWSRYLELIKRGEDKKLIPAYRDMDPYDLPEEFARLQALDMGKIGFLQDLTRGIQKILEGGSGKKDGKPREEGARAGSEETGLLRLVENGKTFLELEYFDRAKDLYHKVTDLYPEAWQGWWGLLSAETKNFSPDTREACEIQVEDGRLALKDEYEKWKNTVERLAGEEADQVLEPYRAYLNACRKAMVEEQEIVLGKIQTDIRALDQRIEELEGRIECLEISFTNTPNENYMPNILKCIAALVVLAFDINWMVDISKIYYNPDGSIYFIPIVIAIIAIICSLIYFFSRNDLSPRKINMKKDIESLRNEKNEVFTKKKGKRSDISQTARCHTANFRCNMLKEFVHHRVFSEISNKNGLALGLPVSFIY